MAQEGGDLKVTSRSVKVEWKIERFFYLPKTVDYELRSPLFTLSNTEWSLRFYPNGRERNNSDWLSLYIRNEPSPSPITIDFTLGIKRADGSVLKSADRNKTFQTEGEGYGALELILKSEFLTLKDIVDMDGTLTLYCNASVDGSEPSLQPPSLKDLQLKIEKYEKEVRELNEKLSAENAEKEAAAASINNTGQDAKKADGELSENLRELFRSRYEGDTTVRVGGKEFLVHKAILAARSSVFRTMFETDMAERKDSIVNIEDCEPAHFEDFLLFIYSGQYDIVRPSNALKLCLIADKYNVVQLTEACFEVMAKRMSAESVCDAVYLATLYEKEELLNTATKFFIENMGKVVVTQKWIPFFTEHPIIANELLVKTANRK